MSKRQLEHLSIDLETLGTTPDSAIISIGAVLFDPYTGEQGEEFQVDIDFESAVDERNVSGSTLKWWMQQNKDAQLNVLRGEATTGQALGDLQNFINRASDSKELKVWGNGATFDISMLEHAYTQFGLFAPWRYFNVRDVRTVVALCRTVKDIPFVGIKHTSLSDAKHQATMVSEVYKRKKL